MPSQDLNFQPAVKCPHCGKTSHPAISGWGGTLSTRTKYCHSCEKEFTLVVYAYASTDTVVTPVKLNQMKRHIQLLKDRIARAQMRLIDKSADLADELVLTMASSGGRQN